MKGSRPWYFPIAQRAALKIVASASDRIAPQPSGAACLKALRHLPRAVSVVTFPRGADWFGITATSLSSLSVEPPTGLLRLRRQHIAGGDSGAVRRQRPRGEPC
jgi:hypothetical protein